MCVVVWLRLCVTVTADFARQQGAIPGTKSAGWELIVILKYFAYILICYRSSVASAAIAQAQWSNVRKTYLLYM